MPRPQDWHPLRLTTPVNPLVFGGRVIADRLGRDDVPDGRVAETWEVSGVPERPGVVTNGELAGRTLHDVALEHPDEVVGRGWRGPHFPVLTKFIDATGMLPVHLHADDATARRLEGQPHGKTEAWHVLDARPGATALVGLKDPGIERAALRDALVREDWDAVLRRVPVTPGDTVYVPGGTLHSFGPGMLVYEIQQTSDISQHAMTWDMEDGSPVPGDERERNLDALLDELRPEPQPRFLPGLVLLEEGVVRRICCAGPWFALERIGVPAGGAHARSVETALVLTNVGPAATVSAGAWSEELALGRSLLVPAAAGELAISGPADVLVGYLPDLERDVLAPLAAAGHPPELVAALGEG